MSNGGFIVLEGPDGSGKSTQAGLLVEALRGEGLEVDHLRDPGGTAVGDRIRDLLLHMGAADGHRGAADGHRGPTDGHRGATDGTSMGVIPMDTAVETYLFLASRAALVTEKIRPALAAGRVVVCERFTMSTVVYQGRAADPPLQGSALLALRTTVAGSAVGVEPDLVLVLDVAPGTGLARKAGPAGLDRIERRGEEFQERVRQGYLAEARLLPRATILAPGTVTDTADRVLAAVRAAMGPAVGPAVGVDLGNS